MAQILYHPAATQVKRALSRFADFYEDAQARGFNEIQSRRIARAKLKPELGLLPQRCQDRIWKELAWSEEKRN